jgi:two-component system sensor histidine kinase YesM
MQRYWKQKKEKLTFRLEQLSLQKRLVIAYIMIMLVPSILISLYIFQGLTGNTVQELQKNNENALEIEQINIKNNMETMTRAAQVTTSDPKVLDYIAQPNGFSVAELIELDQLNLKAILRLQYNNPGIEMIRIFMSNPATNEMWPVLVHESRIQNEPWYETVMASDERDVWRLSRLNRDVTQPRLSDEEISKPKIVLYKELQRPQGTHVGILEIDMLLTNFMPNTFGPLQDFQSLMVVLDEYGNLIRSPANGFLDRYGVEDEILQKQFSQVKTDNSGKGSFKFNVSGVPFLGVYSFIEPLNAYMIKVASLKPVYDGINETRNRIIMANVILLVILTLATSFLNSFILKKLHVLTDSMKKVRQGDFGFDIPIRGGGEVGDLAHHFRKMLRKINELIADAVNKQAAAKEAELATLKNQIDSHFLYNTLENIKMMAEINDQREISNALTSLGSMMRYNMRWTSEYVRLRDELNHIENYIRIANIRFEDRIKLVTDIPERFLSQELLKMSLQPVIENAVQHGLRDKGLVIVIRAEIARDAMLISVTDDGTGIRPDRVQALNGRIQRSVGAAAGVERDAGETSGRGNGIGLPNVHSRIQMHFGKDYGLQVESEPGSYTRVTLRIPHLILDGRLAK